MANGVKWAFELVDRVTARARNIDGMLARVERTVERVDRATHRLSGGGFGGLAKQGESSAKRVEKAWAGVHSRIAGIGSSFQNLQDAAFNLSFAAAPLIGAGMLGKNIVDAAAYKQDQLTSLTGMLKSRDRASELFGSALAYAAETPFTTREVIDATRQAVSMGFTQRQAMPLLRVAGSLSAGSNKSLDQVMEAFAALRGGDFGQAFGVGQGFTNLNISPQDLRSAGLKFDASGSYKGTISQGLAAVRKIVESKFGRAMEERSRNLSGLASTLVSRPEELFMSLVDDKGNSKALAPLQRLMSNLATLTDFSKEPGKGIRTRFERSMEGLMKAGFGPLADATEGERGAQMITKLLDKLDEFSAWWASNGPGISREVRGFGEGLKMAGDGAATLVKPLTWVVGLLDRHTGGDGQGVLGKLLGIGVGAALLGRLGNFLTGGMLGKLGGKAGATLLGGLKTQWVRISQGILTRGFLGQLLTHPQGLLAGARAGLAALGGPGGLGALVSTGIRAVPVVGWIIAALGALKTIGDAAYNRWQGFARLMDQLGSSAIGRLFTETPETATGFNRVLHFDLAKWIQGQPQAWEGANKGFLTGVNDMAARLGVKGEDILKVMNLESGLDPRARNWDSGASGLIQFLPDAKGMIPGLDVSASQLRGMTREQQLPYVEKYLRQHGVKAGMGLEQLYMSVLRGNPATGELWRSGSIQYTQNAGLDANKDGIITSSEATGKVEAAWQRDAGRIQQQLNITITGGGELTKEQLQQVEDAVRRGTLNANAQLGLESGWAAP